MQENKRKSKGGANLIEQSREEGTREEERVAARRSAMKRGVVYKTMVFFRVRREKIYLKKKLICSYGWQLLRAGASSWCPRALSEEDAC